MKCRLPNVHELFLCVGFSFSGCYSSQQLSQNNILLTTIKLKTFHDYFVKFKDFKALNLVQSDPSRAMLCGGTHSVCVDIPVETRRDAV